MTAVKHPPRVSVIIPVRNGKAFIQEAIDSVLMQSMKEFEILVIDDGSSDFDYSVLQEQDPRIRVLRLEGRGVSFARNTGMREARGEFFAFLDADDVWFPGKLESQVRYFDAHPGVGVVFGGFKRWLAEQDGEFPPAYTLWSDCSSVETCDDSRSGWIYTRLLMGLLVGMNTAVIRRSVFRTIGGFNESMRLGEDYDYWVKASRVTEMHALAATVALYRIHGASAMHKLSNENHLGTLLRSAQFRWGIANPDGTRISEREFQVRVSTTYFDHGYSHYWHGNPKVARSAFWTAFIGGGRRLRAAVYLLLAQTRVMMGKVLLRSAGQNELQ